MEFAAPAAYAVLLWWFTTGAILFLDGLRPETFGRSLSVATVALGAALYELHATRLDTGSAGAYAAFTCAIVVWGWLEMSFLMGFITGPRRHACLERCSGARHFLHATQAIIYNELATLAGAALLTVLTWHAPNRVGLWTYLILWSMRLSAKLNLFFGVPNLGEQFLPPHLQYLKSFFRKRKMNLFFPLAISASSGCVFWLAQRYLAADGAFQATGDALMVSLLALAVIEHWFMVLPLPSEKLWRWALRSREPRQAAPPLQAAKTP